MLKRINNTDFKNLFFLIIQNIANYVFPFITFSYLIRTVGFEKFGLITFVNSFFAYIIIIVEYGYIISATKDISVNIGNKLLINKIISIILSVKSILFLGCIALLFFTYPFNNHLQNNLSLYLITIIFAAGQSFNPVWFFQGIQNLKNITITNVIIKTLQTGLIFIFIRKEGDYIILQIINSICTLLVSMLLYFSMYYKYGFRFVRINTNDILKSLKDGWLLFISNVSMTLYTTTISVFLGFFHGNLYVGYYSASEKLISAVKVLISPISQIVYPKMAILSKESKELVLRYNKKILIIGGLIFTFIGLVFVIFSKHILIIVLGEYNLQSNIVLKILSFLPLILFLHSVFALCTLLVFSENKIYSRIIISGGILNIIVAPILIYFFKAYGAAFAVMIVEIYILLRYIYSTEKRNYSLFKSN
ncbi:MULTISPECIES: oligosaccharide flippase family protein [unclassified Chryseobacterium]|uniref:oligosaccharide flippase family protein n=1 Tax=unclassified Chryseobacterium TaxID=2593645 RepID=UPI00226AA7E9|nr:MULTISPECIES: oligosaccharide flippase family protein [unclassified Chryseobacterium]